MVSELSANRSVCTTVNQWKSSFQNISSGVPQGSVLGPLLCVIFYRDVWGKVSSACAMFADDTLHAVSQLLWYQLNTAAVFRKTSLGWAHARMTASQPSTTPNLHTCSWKETIIKSQLARASSDLTLAWYHSFRPHNDSSRRPSFMQSLVIRTCHSTC